MCAFQTDLSILKDYDTDFLQARSSEKRTIIKRTEVPQKFYQSSSEIENLKGINFYLVVSFQDY